MNFSEIWWILLIMALGSYLIGSINFSILISRKKGKDIRNIGSGTPGMMNMSRNFGLKTGVAILLLDMLKGGIPTFIGWVVFQGVFLEGTDFDLSDIAKYLCGFFAVLGHIFPLYLKFKGGKGIASTIGVFVVACPLVGIISALAGLVFILITSMGSMGSLIAVTPPAIAAEIYLYTNYLSKTGGGYTPAQNPMMTGMLLATVVFIIGICLLTWIAHRRNIERLITGEEHQTSWSSMIKKYKEKKRAERKAKKEARTENK